MPYDRLQGESVQNKACLLMSTTQCELNEDLRAWALSVLKSSLSDQKREQDTPFLALKMPQESLLVLMSHLGSSKNSKALFGISATGNT